MAKIRSNKPAMSTLQAMTIAHEIVMATAIRGMRPVEAPTEYRDSLSLEFERAGREATCYLYVRANLGDIVAAEWAGVTEGTKICRRSLRVEIVWSSTNRSVASARTNLALYAEVLDLAAEIEARFERESIGDVIEPKAPKAG